MTTRQRAYGYLPSQERLRELFDYHPDGHLVDRRDGSTPGLHQSSPYRTATVDGGRYGLHRLIYMWHHGSCPGIVDHEDEDTHNNREGNLRDGTSGLNQANCTRARKKYRAFRLEGGKRILLGIFGSQAEASAAEMNS